MEEHVQRKPKAKMSCFILEIPGGKGMGAQIFEKTKNVRERSTSFKSSVWKSELKEAERTFP